MGQSDKNWSASIRPIGGAFSISPDDDDNLTENARGIYVGVSGNLKVTFTDGTTVTLTNLIAGVWHPMEVEKVFDTGTTADEIFGGK